MIGFSLGLTALRNSGGGNAADLAFLFVPDLAGFWADGAAPPAFDPAQLFGPETPGFYAGGFAPPAFTPDLLFGTDTPGFYAGGYEATP